MNDIMLSTDITSLELCYHDSRDGNSNEAGGSENLILNTTNLKRLELWMTNDYFESRMSRNEWMGVGKGKYFQQRGTRITCRTSLRDVQCRSIFTRLSQEISTSSRRKMKGVNFKGLGFVFILNCQYLVNTLNLRNKLEIERLAPESKRCCSLPLIDWIRRLTQLHPSCGCLRSSQVDFNFCSSR